MTRYIVLTVVAVALIAIVIAGVRESRVADEAATAEPAREAAPAAAPPIVPAPAGASTVERVAVAHPDGALELVAAIERQLGGMRPPALDGLFALVASDAGEPELRRYIATRLGSPLALRLVVTRWLDARLGKPAPSPTPFTGGGVRRIGGLATRGS